eukprot:11317688-Alexandrium_andersonii.AAC.1
MLGASMGRRTPIATARTAHSQDAIARPVAHTAQLNPNDRATRAQVARNESFAVGRSDRKGH